jgi:hypothetical protein
MTPKASEQKPLPCGCVRNGQRCAEAQRLWSDAYQQMKQRGWDTETFKDAIKKYERHREGK